MVSSHSRRRFRDIAALVDLADEESEVTATTSFHMRTMPARSIVNEQRFVNANEENNTTTTSKAISFVDQLKNQRHSIQKQESIDEEGEDYFDGTSFHLSASLLQQHSGTPFHNTNVALDGDETSGSSDSEDLRSNAAYSQACLSMEAEAGKFWGGSTAHRYTKLRIQEEKQEEEVEGASLFRSRFNDKLRSRFSPRKQEQKQPTKTITANKSPVKPKPTVESESYQEIVLNSTDSTEECTVSSNRSSHMEYHENSYELPLPIETIQESPIRQVDEESSVSRWESPGQPEDELHDESWNQSPIRPVQYEENVPSWKLKQRLKMRERMGLLDDTEQTVSTPPRSSQESNLQSNLQNVVTPATETPSIESPSALGRTRSWRSKEFRRTFQHRNAAKKQFESDEEEEEEEELDLAPTVSIDEEGGIEIELPDPDSDSEDEIEIETEESESNVPESPVKRLTQVFESTNEESEVNDSPPTMLTKSALKDHQISDEASEDADENDVAEENAASEISVPQEEPLMPPADWWIEMANKVDRYHGAVVAKSESQDGRKSFEDFAETQNQLGRAMAVALYRGIEVGREELQEAHDQQMLALQEKHEQELLELKQQLAAKNTAANARTTTTPVTNTANRNEAFRQRWKSRMSSNLNSRAPTEAASTVVSNMSCRELSVERYRARILAQMNRGKKPSSPSVSNLSMNDDRESDASTPTTASETQNKQNAQEIQRLLDELQQAERRQKLLEKQLHQAGVVLAEDIPYQLAKDKVAAISKRMNEIGSSDVRHDDPLIQKQLRDEYFRLEKDMQKYLSALMLTDEFAQEQRLEAEKWEQKHQAANQKALVAIRKHMPLDIRTLSAQQLEEERGIPKAMVQKFRRTNVLQLLRVDPEIVAKWHPSTLEAYRVTGLTLTERRAIHAYLLPVAEIWRGKSDSALSSADPMTTRKLAWFNTMRTNFQEALSKYERHLGGENGTPRRHVHSTCLQNRCNLIGNQCPVRNNRALDYFSTDLGFPFEENQQLYEAPKLVVGNKGLEQKSPAEIIAEARGQPQQNYVYESPARVVKPKKKATLNTSRPRHPLMMESKERPKHPMSKGPAKPNALLAAIAARRID